MALIIADTDLLIDSIRQKRPSPTLHRAISQGHTVATTAVTVFELSSGVRTTDDRARVDAVVGRMEVVPLDTAAAEFAAAIRRVLEQEGRRIDTADYLIAGITMRAGGILATRNISDFGRIAGLTLFRADT